MESPTISRLRRAVDALRTSQTILLRSQIEGLLSLLKESAHIEHVLLSLEARAGQSIASKHTLIFNRDASAFALDFAPSLQQRALLGLRLLHSMYELEAIKDYISFWQHIGEIGGMLEQHGNKPAMNWQHIPSYIKTFVQVFVDPIIDYLDFAIQRDDQVVGLMVRYKQRSEWFQAKRLVEVAQRAKREVEELLKRDFYAYLFDEGVEFTVAPESPASASEVDVLTARLPDGTRLLCEGKVFDGENRTQAQITGGISQAAEYAYHWSEPRTYVLVYNIAPGIRLNFPWSSAARRVMGR